MLQNYLPSSDQEIALKDRLARDPENETIRNFLIAINEIKKFRVVNVSYMPDVLVNKDLSSLDTKAISEIIQQTPSIKEELEYYLQNRSLIESLKKYLEASSKVGEVAKDFFKKK